MTFYGNLDIFCLGGKQKLNLPSNKMGMERNSGAFLQRRGVRQGEGKIVRGLKKIFNTETQRHKDTKTRIT